MSHPDMGIVGATTDTFILFENGVRRNRLVLPGLSNAADHMPSKPDPPAAPLVEPAPSRKVGPRRAGRQEPAPRESRRKVRRGVRAGPAAAGRPRRPCGRRSMGL